MLKGFAHLPNPLAVYVFSISSELQRFQRQVFTGGCFIIIAFSGKGSLIDK